mmetsp:Transcript_20651/g.61575  ORF Transcript_20651/g.61575 Transcript_20651/m.61575 type:complete len:88 (-) Transcript_20651:91-354(-)
MCRPSLSFTAARVRAAESRGGIALTRQTLGAYSVAGAFFLPEKSCARSSARHEASIDACFELVDDAGGQRGAFQFLTYCTGARDEQV